MMSLGYSPISKLDETAVVVIGKLVLKSWCEVRHDIFTANLLFKWIGRLCFVTLQEVRSKVATSKSAAKRVHLAGKEWDNGETGRSVHNVCKVNQLLPMAKARIMFVTGRPTSKYLKRFNYQTADSVAAKPQETLYTCYKLPVYNITTNQYRPSADLTEPLWWKESRTTTFLR
ncbi:hypothetical protein AVEN_204411-1 [Araneus ventricosus]|uniref:Uncharacterized protein n=1 Tax=Araneus ventricosus TaxID=182803 RepID=A0A4Y2LRP6_ARAVE|nr:hypothetical protein AVEN_204411-1 [Araneus ventricosus]